MLNMLEPQIDGAYNASYQHDDGCAPCDGLEDEIDYVPEGVHGNGPC